MKKVRIGMISFAHMHAFGYLRKLIEHPDVDVVGIADADTDRVAEIVGEHGLSYFGDYRQLLATDVDGIIICSENCHHARLTIDAARAGKHVLCEKPLGLSVREMQDMIEACEANGVQLMTAFPCRYLPAVKAAKEAIERGAIGEILAIKGTNRGKMPGDWFVERTLSGGGALLDHTVHIADLMNWFLASEPVEVYAEAGTLFHKLDIEDAGMVHIQFANGVIAVLDPSWSRPQSFPTWGDVTMDIIGTGGVLSIDGFAQKNEVYSDAVGGTRWDYWGDDSNRWMIHDFVKAIREGTPVPITGQDGLNSGKVALAAYQSIKEQTPYRLSYEQNRRD